MDEWDVRSAAPECVRARNFRDQSVLARFSVEGSGEVVRVTARWFAT
jgi:hypothetical protein